MRSEKDNKIMPRQCVISELLKVALWVTGERRKLSWASVYKELLEPQVNASEKKTRRVC